MRKVSQVALLGAMVLLARLHLEDAGPTADASPSVRPPVALQIDLPETLPVANPSTPLREGRLRAYLERHRIPHHQLDLPRLVDRINRAASRNRIEPGLVLAVIRTESTFQPDAVSQMGARGLMQLLPGTAESLAPRLGLEWEGDQMLHDPEVNIELGTLYLRMLLDRFDGDLDLALEAYYRGPTRLARLSVGGGPMPSSYARRVLSRREELR
jgi:soluble lytic murein transglycosylase-like protein